MDDLHGVSKDMAASVASPTETGDFPARRPSSLAGVRLGLLNNGKPNAALLLQSFGWQLADRFKITKITTFSKEDFSESIDDELVTRIRDACDVVLVGVGD